MSPGTPSLRPVGKCGLVSLHCEYSLAVTPCAPSSPASLQLLLPRLLGELLFLLSSRHPPTPSLSPSLSVSGGQATPLQQASPKLQWPNGSKLPFSFGLHTCCRSSGALLTRGPGRREQPPAPNVAGHCAGGEESPAWFRVSLKVTPVISACAFRWPELMSWPHRLQGARKCLGWGRAGGV